MAFELGIIPNNEINNSLCYDLYELSLETTIERLKS